jgi:hypothetical protein
MTKIATAADVRAYYRADEKRMARLSPEARKTVAPGARGLLSPAAVKDHNRFRKVKFVPEASRDARLAATTERKATRAALVAEGKAGLRGPVKGTKYSR